ncbi:MAG: ABC transporter ATP-binding protein [Anaerolineae bacterium]
MTEEPFVVCDNLVKIYKVADLEVVALQGLDLVIAPGELLGVVGASGSGKSTLMNILGGLDRPSAGRVWVGGADLLEMSDAALDRYRRAQVGFVWQQGARNLIPYLNARENVEWPMTLAGKTGAAKRKRAAGLLEAVGLADRQHHQLSELSGGEQQRVAIAVALANEPVLLLADEPTGEVDSTTAQTIYDTIRTLNRELKVTTLIVSHDPGIARHVDRVVAIRDGRLAAETVRRAANGGASPDEAQPGEEAAASGGDDHEFEELIVIDSTGRLQVPRQYLEHFAIKGRVRLELTGEGILIRPAADADRAENAEAIATEMVQAEKALGWRDRLIRRRRRPGREDTRE